MEFISFVNKNLVNKDTIAQMFYYVKRDFTSILFIKMKKAPAIAGTFLVGEGGFEPPKPKATDLQSAPFDRSGIPPY